MIVESRTMCQFYLVYFTFLSITSFVEGQINVINNETAPEVKSILDSRIVNGTEAYLGQFPSLVSLRRTLFKSHFCGGNIIHLKWILTAAHCMYINKIEIQPYTITVVAGNLLLQGSSRFRQERIVKQIIIHQGFNSYTLENDITLLEVKEPFVENHAIQLAKFPTSPTIPRTVCQVAGWGYLSADQQYVSNELMFVKVPLLSQKMCRKLLINVSNVPDGMLCAGYIEGGKDACQGDSGGGMVCNNYLTGVVSGGEGCAKPKSPGLYSDVFFYRMWINSSIHTTDIKKYLRENKGTANFGSLFWHVLSALLGTFAFNIILT